MKKLIVIILMSLPFFMTAQTSVKGKTKISIGLAGPNTTKASISSVSTLTGLDLGDQSSTPFYIGSITHGVTQEVEAGVYVGYHESTSNVSQAGSFLGDIFGDIFGDSVAFKGDSKFTVTTVGVKVALHTPSGTGNPIFDAITSISGLDTYVSGYLGYNFVSESIDVTTGEKVVDEWVTRVLNSVDYPPYTYSVNAGFKYDITQNIGVYGEVGYGKFLFNGGATYQF